jgi:hypothetical protein
MSGAIAMAALVRTVQPLSEFEILQPIEQFGKLSGLGN